ncbi:hypothetical protein D5086_026801 [Populus alba]|uniref:Uncharacterized protein n=1 Tax=Populus alba TaxID=43335 RepID=A0ACC4B3A2_POPAL
MQLFKDVLSPSFAVQSGQAVICLCHGYEKERRRSGCPRKRGNIEGKRLFDEESSSEEEDSISGSDREDAHDEEEKQDEEEEEEAPLIHSIRSSSKLRSLKLSRDENKGQRSF